MTRRFVRLTFGLAATLSLGLAIGCGASTPPTTPAAMSANAETKATNEKTDEAHDHKPGAHGGILVSLGRDSYHIEAVFEKGGTVRLYLLGKDEARIQETDLQELTAYLTPDGATEADKMIFRPEPQSGDTKGKTSLFVATLPKELLGKKIQVTVNNINVNGERFRIAFSNEIKTEGHTGTEMPAKKTNDVEVNLYLTPGGIYTTADIKANGNVTASQKFKGLKAVHDLKPKSGDKICPITLTKANPQFSWIIGGKNYEFCCPPCVDEFVALAKEKPSEIKEPEAYKK